MDWNGFWKNLSRYQESFFYFHLGIRVDNLCRFLEKKSEFLLISSPHRLKTGEYIIWWQRKFSQRDWSHWLMWENVFFCERKCNQNNWLNYIKLNSLVFKYLMYANDVRKQMETGQKESNSSNKERVWTLRLRFHCCASVVLRSKNVSDKGPLRGLFPLASHLSIQ